MPRKSAASLSIVPRVSGAAGVDEPVDLSPAERELWRGIVASKPAEWFGPDSVPVLKEYVRAALMCDRLAEVVERALGSGDPDQIKPALDMRDKESRRAVTLATKLRLTQQSRYTPDKAAVADKRASGKRPWQAA